MSYNPIIIVGGEPNSIFLEIFFKSIKKIKTKNPILLIASKKLVKLQMKKLKFNFKVKLIDPNNLSNINSSNKILNVIDIEFNQRTAFKKISDSSNDYIYKCFKTAFKIIDNKLSSRLINGPITKKYFLKKKYLGITEYISKKYKLKSSAMLIYNKNLAVCPITTHLPLKSVNKSINSKKLIEKVSLIDSFYKKNFNIKPRIGVTGLNPHCESIYKYNEDDKIILPTINFLKKKYIISGPFSADTLFIKKNREKFDVIIGMYHDQVLSPFKTIYEYNAINITLGLPFLRISPDHGTNEIMMGKNLSNPLSLINAIKFLDKH